MKKQLAVLLACVMLFSFSACGQKNGDGADSSVPGTSTSDQTVSLDGMALYAASVEEIEKAIQEGSLKSQYSSVIEISASGVTQQMEMSGDLAVTRKDGLQMSMRTTMNMAGLDVDTAMYSDGMTVYSSAMGQTVKQPLDENTRALLEEQIASQAKTTVDLDAAAVLEQQVTESADGGYTLQIDLDPDSLLDASGLLDGLANTDGMTYQIHSLSLSASLDTTGRLISAKATANMDITQQGQTSTVNVIFNTSYSDIDGDFTITPPEEIDMENAVITESIFTEE